MKRPFRDGDWIAVPLAAGRYAAGIVLSSVPKVVCARVYSRTFDAIPTRGDRESLLLGDDAWCVLVSDRALVSLRWPSLGALPAARDREPAASLSPRILAPAQVERELSLRANLAPDAGPPLRVSDLRAMPPNGELEALPDGTRLQWRRIPHGFDDERIYGWLADRPNASLRLYGPASNDVRCLDGMRNLRHLSIVRAQAIPPELACVTHLRCEGVPVGGAAFFAAFPNVASLAVAGDGANFDLVALEPASTLRALDARTVVLDLAAGARVLARLTALRLYAAASLTSIESLAGLPALRVLALERLLWLASLEPLCRIDGLASLDLSKLPQFSLEELAVLARLPCLRYLRVDVGGRRKNAEVYRRFPLPEPWPFPGTGPPFC